ncbi:hypothetical protein V5O48_013279 [Marasmius crinis-equi]|uniref:YTH domain-containing protein n=1 Tax=Marasmius crinis-equi TaxID=585013 RepID=A0ABR3F0I7_9AGAR
MVIQSVAAMKTDPVTLAPAWNHSLATEIWNNLDHSISPIDFQASHRHQHPVSPYPIPTSQDIQAGHQSTNVPHHHQGQPRFAESTLPHWGFPNVNGIAEPEQRLSFFRLVEETIRKLESELGAEISTPKSGIPVGVEQVRLTAHEVPAEHQASSLDTSQYMSGDDRAHIFSRRIQLPDQLGSPSGHTEYPGTINAGPTTLGPGSHLGHNVPYFPSQAENGPSLPYRHPPSTSTTSQRSVLTTAPYTIPPQQQRTMAIPTFSYVHGDQHLVPPDPGIMSQTAHANHQSMMAPYPHHQWRQSSDSNSPHIGLMNPVLSFPPVPPNNPEAFQSSRNSSSIPPSSQYPYRQTPPVFSPPPFYQSLQYNYPRHFASSPEAEGQGTWWYLPHAVPLHQHQRQYDGNPTPVASNQTAPYPISYSPVGQHAQDSETSFPATGAELQSYPMSSSGHSSLRSHDPRPPSTSQSPPPVAVPSQPAPPAPPPDPPYHRTPHTPNNPSSQDRPSPSPGIAPVRKSYDPNPPAHRSEWVMWSGNVPPDATHDELWRFFNQKPATPSPPSTSPADSQPHTSRWVSGVLSIFLISRSSCAFINYQSESALQSAINRFNGLPLRPNDPRCPRLVCRVRKKDDDLRAGVGGQRGVGMHTKWVKDHKGKWKSTGEQQDQQSDLESSASNTTDASSSSVLTSEREEGSAAATDNGTANLRRLIIPRGGGHSNSSGSYASTNSDMLWKYFPKRFFILKSLSQYDLDLSVEKGLWATQKHNEGILDQAYRTSKEVYLIFSVNKSGEFYGYAKMVGPVKQGEHRVSWGPRADFTSSTRSSFSPVTGRAVRSDPILEEPANLSRVLGEGFDTMRLSATDHRASSRSARDLYFQTRMVEENSQPLDASLGDVNSLQSFGSFSPGSEARGGSMSLADERKTAPAELEQQHRKITVHTPLAKFSLDDLAPVKDRQSKSIAVTVSNSLPWPDDDKRAKSISVPTSDRPFILDEEAPLRAMKKPNGSDDSLQGAQDEADEQAEEREQEIGEGGSGAAGKGKEKATAPDGIDAPAKSNPPDGDVAPSKDEPNAWGDSFKVEWICTERLPFYRTRHIRNPWNNDREIKVSRDGTELEPSVGQQLLDEWERFVTEIQASSQARKAASSTR